MSKITKTVTYEIEPNGDCTLCESMHYPVCCAFSQTVSGLYPVGSLKRYIIDQCQECRDYLAEQKSKKGKIYCKDCVYLNKYELCENWNETKRDDEGNLYSSNCQDREE